MYRSLSLFRRCTYVAVALGASACSVTPPVQEMSDARQAISAATQSDAERLAPLALADARRLIGEAAQQIRNESYEPARDNAMRAKRRAVIALRDAQAAASLD